MPDDRYKNERINNSERKFWRKYNKFYHHYEKSITYRSFLRDLESLIDSKNNEVWLDVGCGAGRIVDLIKNKSGNQVKKIIGIDIDKDVLLLARQKFRQDIEKGVIDFFNIDVSQKTIFRDEEFDGIVANFVFPYVIIFENQYTGNMVMEMLTREMYRILKYDGRLIWSTLNNDFSPIKLFWDSKKDIFSSTENVYYALRLFKFLLQIKKKKKKGIYHALSRDEIGVLLRRIGFRNIIYKESLTNQALIIKAEK